MSVRGRALMAVGVVPAVLALAATPALAARGHVFSTTFGSEGSGPGRLKEPQGVAVSETGPTAGDVYVADLGNNRVQWFSFNPGTKAYEVAGQVKAATTVGTGTLTEGSKTVESAAATEGAFIVGESITGEGIPAGTTIVKVEPFGAIEISNPVGTLSEKPTRTLVPLTAEQPLHEPRALAVDNSPTSPSTGDVYVSTGEYPHQVIDKFTAEGKFIEQITHTTPEAPSFQEVLGIAVDPAGALWAVEANEVGVAFPTVDHFNDAAANEFQHSCLTSSEGAGSSGATFGLAVDSHEHVYLRTNATRPGGSGTVVEVNSKCEEVNGTLDAQSSAAAPGVTYFGVAVEAATGDVYVDNVESIGRFTPAGGESERFGTGDLASTGCNNFAVVTCSGGVAVNGAAVGPTAKDVYAAVGAAAHVAVFALEEPAAPTVETESAVKLTNDSVTLQGEVNPRSLPVDAATEYHFEFDTAPYPPGGPPHGTSTPVETLAPSFNVDDVSAPVEGLHAGTVYHYRLVASNSHNVTLGEDRSFTTRGTGGFVLPDGRQWEMVSPAAMHGALIQPLGHGGGQLGATTQAASGGSAVAYAANSPTEAHPVGFPPGVEVLSTRGSAGWSSQDISAPHTVATGLALSAPEVRLFSEDLSLAAVQPLGSFLASSPEASELALSPAASEQTAYLRESHTGAYTPLVTGCPAEPAPCPPAVAEQADVPAGTVFGQLALTGEACPRETVKCGAQFVGASPDLKHVIVSAHVPLRAGANTEALYEWNAGAPASQQLQLASLLPPNEKGEELPATSPALGRVFGFNPSPDQRGAVSADGSRVFFSAQSHLYMRDLAAGRTVQIDTVEPGCKEEVCGGGAQEPEFQYASSDGGRVFFKDKQKLTADGREYSFSEPLAADLYVCELHEDVCAVKDLAPAGAVRGEVAGASADGSSVYFAANTALAAGAVSGSCVGGAASEIAPPGSLCNLYAERLEGGKWTTRLVSVVSGDDQTDWGSSLEGLAARVSPDGDWLAFMSQRSLTGYDNRDAVSGRPDQEVFLYEAAHGRLTCASCDPSGARPHGVEYGSGGVNVPLLGNTGFQAKTWLAASVPAYVRYAENRAEYQPRYLSDSGRLFFDSHDDLVPKDVNNTGDVYEFQPAGVPEGPQACGSGTASGASVYRPAHSFKVEGVAEEVEEVPGCVGLMSSGSSSEESAFFDASESGGDVFFISTAKLSPADVEGGLAVYDAHECTTASPCIPAPASAPPPCTTEASCKAAPSPQPSIFGPSGSATFSGPGNPAPPPPRSALQGTKGKTTAQVRAEKLAKALKACHTKRNRHNRTLCEKQARKKYGAVKASAKRSTAARAGKR